MFNYSKVANLATLVTFLFRPTLMTSQFVTGLLSGLALIIAIGAQNSFVLRQGLRGEHLLPIALICALADAVLIAAGIAGLGLLVQRSPLFLEATRYGGAIFLMTYSGLAAWRAWHGEQLEAAESEIMPLKVAIGTCLGFTLLNPHVYLDTVVFLGALANQHGETGRWVFGAGAGSASFIWFFGLAYGARLLSPLFQQQSAWRVLNTLISLTMLSLSISLLQSSSLGA